MSQNRTIISKIIFTNWGTSSKSHETIKFSPDSTLFTGYSGGGKSTIIDALEVVLFGSLNSSNFNIGKKTTDGHKDSRRTVATYLKGYRKDYVPLREGIDFYSNIVIEIYDQETKQYFCAGVVFEVLSDLHEDSLPSYEFFTLNGEAPTDEFLNYSFKDLELLIEKRSKDYEKTKPFVCRQYSNLTNYKSNLGDKIFGGINMEVFFKLQRATIVGQVPGNGTVEDYIKNYVFLKQEGTSCESIIKHARSIKDMKRLLENKEKVLNELKFIDEKIVTAETHQSQILTHELETENIKALNYEKELSLLKEINVQMINEYKGFQLQYAETEAELEHTIDTKASIKQSIENSDYGRKQEELKTKQLEYNVRKRESEEWERFLKLLSMWFEDSDLPVPPMAEAIFDNFKLGSINIKEIEQLKGILEDAHKEIEDEVRDMHVRCVTKKKELETLEASLRDLQKNEYEYRNKSVKTVRKLLNDRLSMRYPNDTKARASIFSRTFEITDEEWRNAIEGRLGAKAYLIVPPQYYDTAHEEFKKLDSKGVHLIDSQKMLDKKAELLENSLYECVSAKEDYVDASLKYYLGRITKCESITDFRYCENGVMKDCFSYNLRSSYQLNKEDYTKYASIGLNVTQKMINQKKEEIELAQNEKKQLDDELSRLDKASKLNTFSDKEAEYLFEIGKSADNFYILEKTIEVLKSEVQALENGDIVKLEKNLQDCEEKIKDLKVRRDKLSGIIGSHNTKIETNKQSISNMEEKLAEIIVCKTEAIVEAAEKWFNSECKTKRTVEWIISKRNEEISSTCKLFEREKNELLQEKTLFLNENPSYGLEAEWGSNEQFKMIYEHEAENFNESLKNEYEEMYLETMEDLKNSVIDKLNGQIKDARIQASKANSILQGVQFGNNYYKLEISRAKNSYGGFYEMLTSKNLDLKISGDNTGQLSFADISLENEYEKELDAFMVMFTPPDEKDYNGDELRYREAYEKFKKQLDIITDYRTYVHFSLKACVDTRSLSENAKKMVLESSSVDKTASKDSGGEEASAKYIALLLGFAMLYATSPDRKTKLSLVMMDEAFNKLDKRRTKAIIEYAQKLDLQLLVCSPDKEGEAMSEWFHRTVGFVSDEEGCSKISQFEIVRGDLLNA